MGLNITAQKAVGTAANSLQNATNYFGNMPDFAYLGITSGKPTKIFTDKFGRKITQYTKDALVIAENKGGSKIIESGTTPRIQVTFDKTGRVVRETNHDFERIYFPNGNFAEIGRKNGHRLGYMIFYTQKHPRGIGINTYRTDGKNRYSIIKDYDLHDSYRVRSNDNKIDILGEKQWFSEAGKCTNRFDDPATYSPELFRLFAKENL